MLALTRRASFASLILAGSAAFTPPVATEVELGLETFDVVWRTVREMLARLGQSHFELMAKEDLPGSVEEQEKSKEMLGGCGIDLRLRDEQFLVTRLEPGSPADDAGVPAGWVLTAVDGRSATELALGARESTPGELHPIYGLRMVLREVFGTVGSDATLTLLDERDAEHTFTLTRTERNVTPFDFGHGLRSFYLEFEAQVLQRQQAVVGLVHFSSWFRPMMEPIRDALDAMEECDGIILDLRGNSGGDGSMVGDMAGFFFDERVLLGVQGMRDGEMRYKARPRKRGAIFEGPLAILVDETTGSTSEVFTGGVQSVGRARIFGETSAGAVLPATLEELPNGDALMCAIGDSRTCPSR